MTASRIIDIDDSRNTVRVAMLRTPRARLSCQEASAGVRDNVMTGTVASARFVGRGSDGVATATITSRRKHRPDNSVEGSGLARMIRSKSSSTGSTKRSSATTSNCTCG